MSYKENYLNLKKRQEILKANPMSGIFIHQEKDMFRPSGSTEMSIMWETAGCAST